MKKSSASTYLRTSGKIASWTMISRILGFIRDLVFANFFGAGPVLDAFLVAFKIPNYMRRFFSEGALTQAFIPIYTNILGINTNKAKAIATQTALLLGTFLLLLTAIVILKPQWFIQLFAWGLIYDPERFNLACQMIQWTFPFLFCIALTTLFSGVMNTHNIFSLPAFLPTILNITLITAALSPISNISLGLKVAMSVSLAGIIQLTIAYMGASKFLSYDRNWDWPTLKKIFLGMAIILGGATFSQINTIFDTIFASFLPRGSISWLYYADRLNHLPIGVVAVSISTLLLPKLSSSINNKDKPLVRKQIQWGIQMILVGTIPCVTMLALFGKQIVICLFFHGTFSNNDVHMTSMALTAMAIGLPAFMFNKLLNTIFYAHKQIKRPTYIACFCAIFSICLNIVLVPLYHHVGIALTSSISAWIQCLTLFHFAFKNDWIQIDGTLFKKWCLSFLGSVITLWLIKLVSPHTSWWLQHATIYRFELLTLICIIFLGNYFLQLKFIGLKKQLKL